ncbi:BaiN/RdsA family NAD(P)/FAD-dependent oxidoreductase [Psychroflexus aestuariivivens]|uniref:NAD(P)/FAD-dependent oxidoreductase n=1 Tax=Psychroflexus aestuariivivens TaxID=1795040 RepID=UPI000FDB650B|nr:NAD(P)/FAD-dependent oxidoreductase [Psychroflexus aestuariivivens]
MKSIEKDLVIVGGGAAGFFAAINFAEQQPNATVCVLEKSKNVLSKVKISGGGRCNVAHAEFEPLALAKNYPRGHKELRGSFHQFMTGDMMAWLEERGVELKIESDQRIFPISDDSQTIIDCFQNEVNRLGVKVITNCGVNNIQPLQSSEYNWEIETSEQVFHSKKLLIATGSSPKMWKTIEKLNHTLVSPVPSLFTFNIQDEKIKDLAGISTEANIEVFTNSDRGVPKSELNALQSSGPLLITHWGFSGPCVLKLSAWGARTFYKLNHQFQLKVNWVPEHNQESIIPILNQLKLELSKKQVINHPQFDLPKRLWQALVSSSEIENQIIWADLNKMQIRKLAQSLTNDIFHVNGKSTFKEEFVTAGGVDLKEINFKTFESRIHPNLFFAGEVLNIDAITGGFNFQNAWTSAYISAKAISDDF